MCSTWQLSVPDSGLTCSDQRQPGSKVPWPTVCPDSSTSSTLPVSSLKGRTSSGDSNRFACSLAIRTSIVVDTRQQSLPAPGLDLLCAAVCDRP